MSDHTRGGLQEPPAAESAGRVAPAPDSRSASVALLGLLLFLSGAGSLTLEVVWSRNLKLVFGSTTLAISTILVAYMLGLGLGGLFGGRWAARLRNGVQAYGIFELTVGGYALFVPAILGLYPALNRALSGSLSFWPAAFVRFALSLAALLLPTLLMGATLPVLVAAVAQRSEGLARKVGLLYGMNTLGAVAGTLGATFVLFPALGLLWSNFAGAALDMAAGALALLLLARRRAPSAHEEGTPRAPALDGRTPVASLHRWNVALMCYGTVGFTSLAYEVTWTRALSMITGSSIHAFTAMLAAFLAGIALGSLLGRRWADHLRRPLAVYGAGLATLGAAAMFTILLLRAAPDLMIGAYKLLGPGAPRSLLAAGFVVSVATMLPPTIVLGALFPLVSGALAGRGQPASAVVGDVYFVNTIGAALGAFAAGFALIPGLGLRRTLGLMVAVNLAAAAAVLLWQKDWAGRPRGGLAAALLAGALLAALVQPGWDERAMTRGAYYRPRQTIDVGLEVTQLVGVPQNQILFYRDGINSTISVHRQPGLALRVNGKPDASLGDMPTQVVVGEAPALFGPRAKTGLMVGLASGVSAGSLALHPFRRLDVVEIEPAAVDASHFFDEYNNRPLSQPHLRLLLDDGRSVVETAREKYDLIVSEPPNPYITGVANLFTRDFFRAVRRALTPGGRLWQWVQLYQMDAANVRSIFAALHSEFPYVYGLLPVSSETDLILLAGDRPLAATELPRWENLPPVVQDDLSRVQLFSTADLWSLVRLLPEDVARLASEATTVNTDDSMFVELHAPWLVGQQRPDQRLLPPRTGTAMDVAERAGARLSPDEVGQLALSFVVLRNERDVAERLIAEARRRGPSAAALSAEAMLAWTADPPNPARALQLLDQAVDLAPGAFEPRLLRARWRWEQSHEDQFDLALADVGAALAAQPGDWRALDLRLQILNRLGRGAEALPDADALLKTPWASLDADVWADAAVADANRGQFDEAIRRLSKSLEIRPTTAARWKLLAALRRQVGQADAAREAEDNAAIARRNAVINLHIEARREALFGSTNRAREMLENLLTVDPTYAPAREDLARWAAR